VLLEDKFSDQTRIKQVFTLNTETDLEKRNEIIQKIKDEARGWRQDKCQK